VIRIQDLEKSFGPRRAVAGVGFEVRRGETFGLLGPNGAGKTTILHCIVGLLTPDAGTVEIDGASDPTRKEVRAKVGIAPQSLALYDALSGEENLRFFGKLYGLDGARLKERVDWALEFVGLVDRRASRVSTFSGGMKRRLNLATGLVHDPQVILLDEPTVGVDPQSRNHIFESIEKLKKEGRTILYTTHYMEEAERLCDRIAIMDDGSILALDTLQNLLAVHGGRSTVRVELLEAPANTTNLPADWMTGDHSLCFESDQPLADAARLNRAGIKVRSFQVEGPNLEAVFLTLTGRKLRDE